MTALMPSDESTAAWMVRVGITTACDYTGTHLRCRYPDCGCELPKLIRIALLAIMSGLPSDAVLSWDGLWESCDMIGQEIRGAAHRVEAAGALLSPFNADPDYLQHVRSSGVALRAAVATLRAHERLRERIAAIIAEWPHGVEWADTIGRESYHALQAALDDTGAGA